MINNQIVQPIEFVDLPLRDRDIKLKKKNNNKLRQIKKNKNNILF